MSRRPVAILAGPLGWGGSGRVIVQQASDLLRLGYGVDLLTTAAESPLLAAVPTAARRVELTSLHPLWGTLLLFRYLRRARPHAVIVHRIRLLRPLQRAAALSRIRPRIVAVIHNHLGGQVRSGATGRRQRGNQRLTRCDALVGVSAETAREAAEHLGLPAQAVKVAYPPIDAKVLQDLAASLDAAANIGDQPYLVAVGRLEPQKDFPTLLRAFARVAARVTNLHLVILGEGRERAALEALAASLGVAGRVRLPGFLDNPYPSIAGARLMALTSRWEGFGIVLAEALALGVPVVATDCPSGPREILADGRYGRLVSPGDDEAFAAAVLAALAEPPEPTRLREGALRFTPDAALAVYLNALALPRPARP